MTAAVVGASHIAQVLGLRRVKSIEDLERQIEAGLPKASRGQRLIARGRVVQAARLLTVCAAEVYAEDDQRETLCATLLGTARNLGPDGVRG